MTIEAVVESLGLVLPVVAKPVANYVPSLIVGDEVFISGQLPFDANQSLDHAKGALGKAFDAEAGYTIARQCGLNILANIAAVMTERAGEVQCVKLGVFVNAVAEFTDHPKVANGASDLMVEVLGERGKHTRSAVGVGSLPLGVAVEVDALFKFV